METQIIAYFIILIAGIALGMYISSQISKWIDKNSN
jgi:uncharacterized protein YneF (UPF0154 family)